MTENLNLHTIDTVDTSPFKKLVMTIGELPSSFTESMTYYESLAWLVNYLQNIVIPAVDNNAEALTELQNLYTELYDYVQNYFENLDVQQEINNKLDAMAEDGTLTDIIAAYLQLQGVLAFNNVANMKSATNLVDGSFVKTYGYYTTGDGGSAIYKIREITNQDTVDEMFIIALTNSNTLVAELVKNDRINAKQVGIKGDGETNETTKISKLLNCEYPCYFPNGTYLINQTITITSDSINVVGDGNITIFNSYTTGSDVIFPIIDFSGADNIYIKGITTSNSSFKIYPESGLNYIQAMRDKNVYLESVTCTTTDSNVSGKTNWGLLVNNPAPDSYDTQSGKYANYPIEIINHSGYNALNINNYTTDGSGTVQSASENSAIGITDKVNSGTPVMFIDKYTDRDFMKVFYRDADIKYQQDNTVFEVNTYGNMAIGCKVRPNERLTGNASLKIHSQYPAIMLYEDTGTTVYKYLLNVTHNTSKDIQFFKIDINNHIMYVTNKGTKMADFSTAQLAALNSSVTMEGSQVWNYTTHRPLWFDGTNWIDGAGNTVIQPTS